MYQYYYSLSDKRIGNSFANWNTANEHYKLMLRAILFSKIHVIVCMRSKMEYILQENEKGKHVPQKVGMAPIMRDGVEYEFTTVFDLDIHHQAQVSKDRTQLFSDKIFIITEDIGLLIRKWLQNQQPDEQSKIEQATTQLNGV